jgi:hypothetical protein
MRHRRSAQRRQIHPLQRADQGRHRGGELSLLHHRAQRRHRRSAGSAPRALSEIVKPQRIQPAIVEFVDIAGLVAGASKGEGLGNQFLANIRETDAIVNVVRCFDDDNVVHVNRAALTRSRDIETIDDRTGAGRSGRGRTHAEPRQQEGARRRQGSAEAGRRSRKDAAAPERRQAGAHAGLLSDEKVAAQAAVPDDAQAGDVRRQRRSKMASEQSLSRPPARACREGRRAGRGPVRQDRSRTRRSR